MEKAKNKLTIFVDMDGVLCNFNQAANELPKSKQKRPDLHIDFSRLEPMPGAIWAIHELEKAGHDIFIATTPPWNNPIAWGQKRDWIVKHLPTLERKMFLTHRKDLLKGDILIDDSTYRGQKNFTGTFFHFGKNGMDWKYILNTFHTINQLPYAK
jgi:5'(3')-deoxyribonucleotidase